MSHGKSLKTINILNTAWHNSLNYYSKFLNYHTNWYLLYKNLLFINQNMSGLQNISQQKQSLKFLLSRFVRKSQSIFSLYTYKISKNIYKNTRGKSGKFMFVWKYVPTYKRLFIVSNWLIKELRVLTFRKLQLRLTNLLLNIAHVPKQMWAFRVKTFSYNYVYRSCRKTLASTYLSTKV